MSGDAIGAAILGLLAVILVVVVAFRARQILADYVRPKSLAQAKSPQLSCCEESSWVPERDLDHAAGFEYVLGKCRHCGMPWMSVFCVASGIGGYERVTPTDVEAINALRDAGERKEFMRGWAARNL